VLLGNGRGKSLVLRTIAGMLQRSHRATEDLFIEAGPSARIMLELARNGRTEKIERDAETFLRGSVGRVPLLAIPELRYVNRNTVVAPDFQNLAYDGARHFLEQIPYQSTVEGLLARLALDYWEHERTFDIPSFTLLRDVMSRLTENEFRFKKVERMGITGSQIWVVSQGTLSVFTIFGLIHSFLQDIANARGKDEAARQAREQKSIVLIDEVDEHLYPSWQRRTRSLLTEFFPRVQFILSASNPFVAGGCGPGEVTVLQSSPQGFTMHSDRADDVTLENDGPEVYDFAISFAGPDREYAHALAIRLREGGARASIPLRKTDYGAQTWSTVLLGFRSS